MNKLIVLLLIVSVSLQGCVFDDDVSSEPWMGYALNKSTQKLEWWFSTYKTKEECLESMNWGVTNTGNKDYYSKPVGCGFSSNSQFLSLMYYIFNEHKNFECLSESKNPEVRKIKMKYGPFLKDNEMVPTVVVCVN